MAKGFRKNKEKLERLARAGVELEEAEEAKAKSSKSDAVVTDSAIVEGAQTGSVVVEDVKEEESETDKKVASSEPKKTSEVKKVKEDLKGDDLLKRDYEQGISYKGMIPVHLEIDQLENLLRTKWLSHNETTRERAVCRITNDDDQFLLRIANVLGVRKMDVIDVIIGLFKEGNRENLQKILKKNSVLDF